MSDRPIHWHTSPTCGRILDRLACKGAGTPKEIAADVHCAPSYAYTLLALLVTHDKAAVCGWRHNYQGDPTPIYRIGPGPGVAKPRAKTSAERGKHRRNSLIAKFGRDVANKVLNPKAHGYVQPHVDGHRVRPRDAGPMLAGKVTR